MTAFASVEKCFVGTVQSDLFNMIVGDRIGNGVSRAVYEYLPDPSCVVKVENVAGSFCNALEMNVWECVKGTEHAKWFAPCVQISSNGIYLIQKKTKPWKGKLPDKLPPFFADLKPENLGKYKGHLVFHDYALNNLIECGLTKRLTKVKWS